MREENKQRSDAQAYVEFVGDMFASVLMRNAPVTSAMAASYVSWLVLAQARNLPEGEPQ